VQREANKLVEEFMLLANMSVAALIAGAFPARALLRRHPPPNQRKLDEVSHLSNSLVSPSLRHCTAYKMPLASLGQPEEITHPRWEMITL
jgi:exoribonuclease R